MTDPELAAAAREWLRELSFLDVDPEDFDDHEFITDEEVLRAADKAYDGGLARLARDLLDDDPPIQGGVHDVNSKQMTGQSRWEQFLDWLSRLFGPGTGEQPKRTGFPRGSQGRIDGFVNPPAPVEIDTGPTDEDYGYFNPEPPPPAAVDPFGSQSRSGSRPGPEPQDLDALTSAPPPVAAPGVAGFTNPGWLKVDYGPEWCNCGGMAGVAHQHSAHAPQLNVGGFAPPPAVGMPPAPPDPA